MIRSLPDKTAYMGKEHFMGKSDTRKIILCFGYIVLIAITVVFCVLSYNKKPTDIEVNEYIASLGSTEGKDGAGKATQDMTAETFTTEEQKMSSLLPSGSVRDSAVSLSDIVGRYEGKLHYNALDGYETMDGAPADVGEMVAAELASSPDMSLTIDEDGRWEIEVDSNMTKGFSDDLFTDKDFDGKLKTVDNGYFSVKRDFAEGGDEGSALFEGTVYDVSGTRSIAGHMYVSMRHGDQALTVDVDFTAEYVGEGEP